MVLYASIQLVFLNLKFCAPPPPQHPPLISKCEGPPPPHPLPSPRKRLTPITSGLARSLTVLHSSNIHLTPPKSVKVVWPSIHTHPAMALYEGPIPLGVDPRIGWIGNRTLRRPLCVGLPGRQPIRCQSAMLFYCTAA
eukprot:354732-Chlamydomonas_euryale.AAC.5